MPHASPATMPLFGPFHGGSLADFGDGRQPQNRRHSGMVRKHQDTKLWCRAAISQLSSRWLEWWVICVGAVLEARRMAAISSGRWTECGRITPANWYQHLFHLTRVVN